MLQWIIGISIDMLSKNETLSLAAAKVEYTLFIISKSGANPRRIGYRLV
jgi:hypothetical protein